MISLLFTTGSSLSWTSYVFSFHHPLFDGLYNVFAVEAYDMPCKSSCEAVLTSHGTINTAQVHHDHSDRRTLLGLCFGRGLCDRERHEWRDSGLVLLILMHTDHLFTRQGFSTQALFWYILICFFGLLVLPLTCPKTHTVSPKQRFFVRPSARRWRISIPWCGSRVCLTFLGSEREKKTLGFCFLWKPWRCKNHCSFIWVCGILNHW